MPLNPLLTKLSNAILRLTCNMAFRPGNSPSAMRNNFMLLTSAKRLGRPRLKYHRETLSLGGVRTDVIETTTNPPKNILYFHGGGYFMGSTSDYHQQAYDLAIQCNARVFLVSYRLAPEHPYPAALNDATQAYRALRVRYPTHPIVLGGDSAGGGLTLALLLHLRDQSEELPSGAFCISPWTDLLGLGDSMQFNHGKDVWLTKRHIDAWAPWYYGKNDPRIPTISPVFGDYRGLPPLLVFAGDQEVLLDDAVRVVQRARAAGVQTQFSIGLGMQHDWLLLLPWLEQSKLAMKELVNFIDHALPPGCLARAARLPRAGV